MSEYVGSRWRHKKRRTTYVIVAIGTLQDSPPGVPTPMPHDRLVDGMDMVIYRSEDDWKWHVREMAQFLDGRFEEIK